MSEPQLQPDSSLATAERLHQSGLHEEALQILAASTQEQELSNDARYLRGTILLALGRTSEAVNDLETLLTLNPRHTFALNDLGVLHQQAGRTAKAIECFQHALEAESRNTAALENLLLTMHGSGKTHDAVQIAAQIREKVHPAADLAKTAASFLQEREAEAASAEVVLGRVACLGKDVIACRYGDLGTGTFLNQQKMRIDLFLEALGGGPRCEASVVEPFMERKDVYPLILEQQVLPWLHARGSVKLLVMDSFAELTDRKFTHRKEGWSFCAHYTDVLHTEEFESLFEHSGLLSIDAIAQLYWDFFHRFETSYPAAHAVFINYPTKLDPKKEFKKRGEAIKTIMREIARLKPYILNLDVDDSLVDWSEKDQFPYHFARPTQKAFANRWAVLDDNRSTLYTGKTVKTACVVQGDMRRGVDDVLKQAARTFDVVVLSTWKNDEAKIPAGDFQIVLSEKPEHLGATNRNLQRKSTAAGLALAESLGCTHVMKLRTDMLPVQLDVEKLLKQAHWNVPDGFPSRIVTSAFRNITVDPDWFSTIPDLFSFGSIEMMKLLWGDFEFDYSRDMNIPARMVTECGVEWKKEPEAIGTFCPEAELYAHFKDRLERLLNRSIDHTSIAKQLLYLIDHESLGMCWFDPSQGFRSVVQALEHPWWTEQQWRGGRPVMSARGYHVTEEQRRQGASRTCQAAALGFQKQSQWYREFKEREAIMSFNGFLGSIRPETWQCHDPVLAWAERCERDASSHESDEAYAASEDPVVRQGYQLANEIKSQFRDRYRDTASLRILIHVPGLNASPGGYSLFSNLVDALRFLGVPVRVLAWEEGIGDALEEFSPNVFMTSDHELYLSRIDWGAIERYRASHELKVGLTASLAEYGNTLLQERLEWARSHHVDFYYSFRAPEYLHERKEYSPFFEHGYRIFSIEFAANPLLHYPVPGVSRDLDFVFLGSVNQDKWDRYVEFFQPVLSRRAGFLDGPGWPAIRRTATSLKKDRYLYARAKVGLNLHLRDQVEWANELNERTYILAACGVPQVIDNPKILPARFSDGTLFQSRSPQEYLAHVEYLLRHPEAALERVLRAQREVFSRHTWFHRAEGLIRDLMQTSWSVSPEDLNSASKNPANLNSEGQMQKGSHNVPRAKEPARLSRDARRHAVEYYKELRNRYPYDNPAEQRFVHPAWGRHLQTLGSVVREGLGENFLMHPICLENFVRQGWFPAQDFELSYLHQLPEKIREKLFAVKESPVGGVPVDRPDLGFSVNSLGMYWYYARIHENLSKSPALVAEFGGGYGSLARIFKLLGADDLTYAIIDLPEMLALQYAFLSDSLGPDRIAAHVSSGESPVRGKINLFPVFDVERLQLRPDLFISTFALSETLGPLQNLVAQQRNFFDAEHVYVTGQLPTERVELGWEKPHTIMNAVRQTRPNVTLNRFHIGSNYELLATARANDKSGKIQSPIAGVVFSKDRAMQLDATLRSFFLHCTDPEHVRLTVLYTTSQESYERQYATLRRDYPTVEFRKERSFKADLLDVLSQSPYVLFLVDDNIFVRDFALGHASSSLGNDERVLGVSLRLGRNTTYCYMLDKPQAVPSFEARDNGLLRFDWTVSELDFGYPLELSSSVYRTSDLKALLSSSDYRNPNTLELQLDARKSMFLSSRPLLYCCPESCTFCAPMNSVQTEWANRAGNLRGHAPQALAEDFGKGLRIDVERFVEFSPNGCHQECELKYYLLGSNGRPVTKTHRELVSIVLLNYNGLDNLRLCLDSIARNTPEAHEVIVVDNGSTDGSLEFLHGQQDITLVENSTNLGCPGARAQGMSIARGDYVVLLDNDTVVPPGWISRFLNHAKLDRQIGIIGPRSNYVSGAQIVPNASYKTIAEMEAFSAHRAEEHAGERSPSTRLVGFCMFIRRSVLDTIGNIDGSFGKFGFEDDDYTWRAQIAGFKTVIAHDVFVHHTGGPQGRGDAEYNRQLLAAWEVFKKKWQIGKDIGYGSEFDVAAILSQPFEPNHHVVPLLDREAVGVLLHRQPVAAEELERVFTAGAALLRQGKCEDAIAHFKNARDLVGSGSPQTDEVTMFGITMHLGDSYLKCGLLQEAREQFEQALRLNPESAEACYGMGLCFQYAGINDAALQFFEGAVALKPDWDMARAKLHQCAVVG